MCVINLRTLLISLIFIALPAYATARTKNTLEEITMKVTNVTSNAVVGRKIEDLLINIDVTKLCDLNSLYSKKILDSLKLRTSRIKLPVHRTAGMTNILEEVIMKGIDMISNAVAGIKIKDLFNIDASKSSDLNSLYSKEILDFFKLRTSHIKIKEYICDTTITQIDSEYSRITYYVIGGEPAVHGEFPHMGALGWKSKNSTNKWVYLCGATLISRKFMLTAAHCSSVPIDKYDVANNKPEIVQLGDKFLYNEISYPNILKKCYDNHEDLAQELQKYRTHNGQTIDEYIGPKYVSIKKISNHPDYMAPKEYYDIAIIELVESINFSPLIRPVSLWSNPETSSLEKLLITGWGSVDPVAKSGINELQKAKVNVIDDSTCNELLKERWNRNWHGLSDHQMCAGFLDGGIDVCYGDSGGPLQVKMNFTDLSFTKWPMYYQVGVTSFSFKCARPKTPSIYSKTGSFIDWIEDKTWPCQVVPRDRNESLSC